MDNPADNLSSDHHDKVITPLKVPAGEKRTDLTDLRRQHSRKLAYVISAFLLLTMGGLLLFRYLSRHPLTPDADRVEETASQETPQATISTQPVHSPLQDGVGQKDEQEREEAEQKLAAFLKAKKELDARGGAEWGGEEYRQVLELSRTADAALMAEQFTAASQAYAQATAFVAALMAGMDDILRDTLARGDQALRKGDGTGAEQLFKRALLIDPSHQQARRNLERAKICDRVVQLIRTGAAHEQNRDLDRAAADYREASRLDPESEEAQAALNRVNSLIADQQFQELLSQAMAALHGGDYTRARSLLLKARSLKPAAPEVSDPLAQADSALKRARIDELRVQATAAEETENWSQAIAAYQTILSLDGSIQFAIQGRERTLKRIELEKRIHSYLDRPASLESDQALNSASELLEEARQHQTSGPRFSRLIAELDARITTARTPIPVTIESDGATEVAIYKVGKLGRFTSREVALRPGTYTITGARTGYKDVRHTLSVKADSDSLSLTVTCNEKI